ncbi:GTPase [Clostridium haemolyticum]|nr:GTPase [Clostridium haemolyticum]
MYKNIFITGKRNCGKSTLLNNILKRNKFKL